MGSKNLITQTNPKSPISEAFRTLRTNIQFSSIDKEIRTIVFTSSTPKEGKTTVAANLASSIAMGDKRVLIIDCDLRRPNLHKLYEIPNFEGLTNVLMGERTLDEVLHYGMKESNSLSILTSGPLPPNPSELLSSIKMRKFLENVKLEYDMIILDSPPVGLVTDSAVLSTIVDGTILVIESGKTEIEAAQRAKELLDKVNANILGVVLNKIPMGNRGSYKYSYYQYNDYYGEDNIEAKKKIRAKGITNELYLSSNGVAVNKIPLKKQGIDKYYDGDEPKINKKSKRLK